MSTLAKRNLKVAMAKAMYDDIVLGRANWYYTFGKVTPWTSDASPDTPNVDIASEVTLRSGIVFAKRVGSGDVSLVIKRNNWTYGQVYDDYDTNYTPTNLASTGATQLEDSLFYVFTSQNNVYKCLNNNNGAPSTVMPTGSSATPFTTYDGYVWQFMYVVGGAFTKFVTNNFIPVRNGYSTQYGNIGNITSAAASVSILTGGSGYSASGFGGPSVIVTGDGWRTAFPQVQSTFAQVSFAATTTASGITSGLSTVTLAAANSAIVPGLFVTGYAGIPANTFIVSVSGASIVLSANATLTAGTAQTLTLTGNGSGYTTGVPTFSGTGSGAAGTATISSGAVTALALTTATTQSSTTVNNSKYVTMAATNASVVAGQYVTGTGIPAGTYVENVSATQLTLSTLATVSGTNTLTFYNSGTGYGTGTVIQVVPNSGTLWSANATFTLNQYIYTNYFIYQCTAAGLGGTTAPTHTSGTALNGAATLNFIGCMAQWNSTPIQSKAAFTVNTSAGSVISLTPVDQNTTGYTYANFTFTDAGTGATAAANLSLQNNSGALSLAETTALYGANTTGISSIQITNPGSGYSSVTCAITIQGDGTGATAVPVLSSTGAITGVTITNTGKNYTYATAIITGSATIAGSLRVVTSPFPSHAGNAINELYPTTLMVTSSLSNVDAVNGFYPATAGTNFRQVGLLRNPTVFSTPLLTTTTAIATAGIHGAGFVLTASSGSFNTTNFPVGATINEQATPTNIFVIVGYFANNTKMLVVSLVNSVPNSAATIVNGANTAVISAVNSATDYPTLNKYSGDMLYIDNRAPFAASSTQPVFIRNVIRM